MISLIYDMRLISKDNFKSFNRKTGRPFLSFQYKQFEDAVRSLTIKQYRKPPLTAHLSVHIIVGFRDKRHSDCGNLSKSVLDALQGLVYKNDRQIKHLEVDVEEGQPRDSFIVYVEEQEF